jgi:hypothetical protein
MHMWGVIKCDMDVEWVVLAKVVCPCWHGIHSRHANDGPSGCERKKEISEMQKEEGKHKHLFMCQWCKEGRGA